MGNRRGAPQAEVSKGKKFMDLSTGRWAGEQMLRAMQEGREVGASVLRTADTLRKNEWQYYDQVVVKEGLIRLRGVADLIAAGNVINIPNGLGKTIYQSETITDMDDAAVSLDGMADTANDAQEFDLHSVPLPIVHKDFFLSLRHLMASRNGAMPLDTTQAGTASRRVTEKVESMLFNGGPTYGSFPIYGYDSHPSRIRCKYGDSNNPWTSGTKTGEEIVQDVLDALTALSTRRFYGPFAIYVGTAIGLKLESDFKANGDLSIRNRILQIDGVKSLTVADQMPAGKVIVVQITPDVASMIQGEPLQTVQWDVHGGMRINFKVMTIQVPLIRATESGRCGVLVMETTASDDFADITDVE